MAHAPSKIRNVNRRDSKGLNLIPIMNLFIVIIPMLMTIMVSVHLAMVEIVLPKKGIAKAVVEKSEKPKTLRLNIMSDSFEIVIIEDNNSIMIPVLDDTIVPAEFDYLALNDKLMELKGNHPEQNTMEILPDPDVKYDTLLRTIDICKMNNFPNIKYKFLSKQIIRAK